MFYKKWSGKYPYMEIYHKDTNTLIGYEFAVEDLVRIPSVFFRNMSKAKSVPIKQFDKDYIRIILRGLHNVYPQLTDPNFIIDQPQ